MYKYYQENLWMSVQKKTVSKDALMKSVFGQNTPLVHTDDYNSSSCHNGDLPRSNCSSAGRELWQEPLKWNALIGVSWNATAESPRCCLKRKPCLSHMCVSGGLLQLRQLQTSHLLPLTGIKTTEFVRLEPPAAEAWFMPPLLKHWLLRLRARMKGAQKLVDALHGCRKKKRIKD